MDLLKVCCTLLSSDKITERKKGVDELLHLMNNEDILSCLSCNTSNKQSNKLDWNHLFHCAKLYFLKESERLAKDEQKKEELLMKISRQTLNQKKFILNIPKLVLRKSSMAGLTYISCSSIMEFIMLILNKHKPYLLENFGIAAMQLVQNIIFKNPNYYLSVTLESWNGILKMCYWLCNNKDKRTDVTTLFGVIENIVRNYRSFINNEANEPSVFFKTLPKFLCETACNIKKESYCAQTRFISLLWICSYKLGSQWRKGMCDIVDTTINSLLELWENRTTNRQLRLCRYLNLQIAMHSPQIGGLYKKELEYTSKTWNNALKQMYILMSEMLFEIGQNYMMNPNSFKNGLDLDPEIVIFAARLFSKVFNKNDEIFSINISEGLYDDLPNSSIQPSKRRRVETGFENFCSFLKEEINISKICWFLILEEMIESYFGMFCHIRKGLLLDLLHFQFSTSRDQFIMDVLLKCLCSLCSKWNVLEEESIEPRWRNIFEKTVRLVGGGQCLSRGSSLILTMMKCKLILIDELTFEILKPPGIFTCENGLQLINFLIRTSPIPKFSQNSALKTRREVKVHHLVQILSNMLPINDSTSVFTYSTELAELLLLLCSDDPVHLNGELLPIETSAIHNFCPIEELYLNLILCRESKILIHNQKICTNFNISKDAELQIVDHILNYCRNKNVEAFPNLKTKFEFALNVSYLSTSLSIFMQNLKICQLFKMQSYFVEFLNYILKDTEISKWTTVDKILSELIDFYKYSFNVYKRFTTKEKPPTDDMLRFVNKVPQDLIKTCLDIILVRKILTEGQEKKNIPNPDDMDDSFVESKPDFDEFDILEVTQHNEYGDRACSTDFNESSSQSLSENEIDITLSKPILCFEEEAVIKSATLLCIMHKLNDLLGGNILESKLLDLIDHFSKMAESGNIKDIVIVFPFLTELFSLEYLDDNIDDGIAMLSKISTRHSNDSCTAAQVLAQIRDLLSVNGSNLGESQKTNLIHLIRAYEKKISENSFGFHVRKVMFEINIELFKLDPLRTWSKYEINNPSDVSDIYQQLKSPFIDVKINAAENIRYLLVSGKKFLPHDQQFQAFEKVYKIAISYLSRVEEKGDARLSEGENLRSLYFFILTKMAVLSPFIECYSLYALFAATKTHKINKEQARKTIINIAKLKDVDVEKLMEENLLFIISQWLHDQLNIEDFPVELLGIGDNIEFLRRYSNVIVQSAFNQQKHTILLNVFQPLNISLSDLMKDNFATIFASLVPYLVLQKDTSLNISKKKVNLAVVQLKFLETIVGKNSIQTLLYENLGNVTFQLLNLSHDSSPWTKDELVFPPNQIVYFASNITCVALNQFHSIFLNDYDSIIILLAQQQSSMHIVMNGLLMLIAKANSTFKFRWTIAKINIFVDILIPHLESGTGDMVIYIVKRIIFILTAFTSNMFCHSKYLVVKCFKILLKFLQVVIQYHSEHVIDSLNSLFSILLKYVGDDIIWSSASRILDYLLSCSSAHIVSYLVKSPPLPQGNEEILKGLRCKHVNIINQHKKFTFLQDHIEEFLKLPTYDINEYHLKFLHFNIMEFKDEIVDLYKIKVHSGLNLSHVVLHKLITLSLSTSSIKMKKVIAECLGEFGPINLEHEIFHASSLSNDLDSLKHVFPEVYTKIICTLHRMTYSTETKLIDAATISLRKSLHTEIGKRSLATLSRALRQELLPYTPEVKGVPFNDPRFSCSGKIDWTTVNNRELSRLWVTSDVDIWVKIVTVNLLDAGVGCEFLHSLMSICDVSESFCEEIFPIVFFHFLKFDLKARRPIISQFVRNFFKEETKDRPIRVILRAINYLRMQKIDTNFSGREKTQMWERNLWLDLDFCDVAHAAARVGLYYSAIFYSELYCESIRNDLSTSLPKSVEVEERRQPLLSRISNTEEGSDLAKFLLKIYSDLGDSLGIEGCCATTIVNDDMQIILSRHSENYFNAVAICDSTSNIEDFGETLKDAGLYKILGNLSVSSLNKNKNILDAQAECAWRLGNWKEDTQVDRSATSFNQIFHSALNELHNKNLSKFVETLNRADLLLVNDIDLKESSNCLYPCLTQLSIVSQICKLSECFSSDLATIENGRFSQLANSLQSDELFDIMNYNCSEKILASRISTLKIAYRHTQDNHIKEVLFDTLIKKCRLCLHSKSNNCISQWKSALTECKLLSLNNTQKWYLQVEEAHFVHAIGRPRQSIGILEKISKEIHISKKSSLEESYILSKSLTLCGTILIDYKCKTPKSIIDDYLLKSIRLLEKDTTNLIKSEGLENAYNQLGKYADFLYQEIKTYLDSDQCKIRKDQINNSQRELTKINTLLEKAAKTSHDYQGLRKKGVLLGKEIKLELESIKLRREEAGAFLCLALENYMKAISYSSEASLNVYRIISLWLGNNLDHSVNLLMKNFTVKIKTHHFLPIVYQLVARLSNKTEDEGRQSTFPEILLIFLHRLVSEHPYHTIHVIMMLANSYLDEEILQGKSLSALLNSPKKTGRGTHIVTEDRILASKNLLKQLKLKEIGQHIDELQTICYAYVHFINTVKKPDKRNQQLKVKMQTEKLAKLKNLKFVASLSREISVQPSCNYSPPTILRWDPIFNFCGGVNNPTRLTVYSSDGMSNMELIKGNDDSRQDAVLEQVFSVMNSFLKKDNDAKKHRLNVRTYLVKPISQMTGVIQWCKNTQPIGDVLIDVHERYYPGKFSAQKCRSTMDAARRSNPDQMFNVFNDILANFPPAFRFFFYEEYARPDEWFCHRQAYIRSIATSSIIGYIIGLGDRHVQNILLDKSSAEVVHIDLGIAFENGKLLPTPELIPFRLTQDIIDGFGVAGVEGPFRKYMEMALKVMKEFKTVITTIIEVLKYDPLHQWTLTPKQIEKLQKTGTKYEVNNEPNSVSSAERAFLRVQLKLNGIEDGLVLSIPEQISNLIHQATDNEKLSGLFSGWQPYL